MTSTRSFAADTQLTSVEGDDMFAVDLAERWNVGRNQNGGVLLATVAGALATVTESPHPFAISGQYLAAAEAGPATVKASVIKPGRTYATGVGELWQGDRERVRCTGAFGDLAQRRATGLDMFPTTADPIPAPDACTDLFETLVAGPAGERALTQSLRNFEIRHDPDGGWGLDAAGSPSFRGWMRFRDEGTVTPAMLVAAADGFPPTLLSEANPGWLPTIELSVHVFGEPTPDEPWLRADLFTRTIGGGLLAEDGELWDATGRLVARFRQLAMLIPRD